MVNKNIYIRRAVPADVQPLSYLSAVTFHETFLGTCTDEDLTVFIDSNYNEEQIAKELHDVNDLYFLAFIDNNPIGYLRMMEEESEVPVINEHKSLSINRLYVLKE
ncbi:MAG: hypothetical protein ABI266_08260, partial [Ginsengibacter sp.]